MRCKDGTIVLKSADELATLLVEVEEYFTDEVDDVLRTRTDEVDEAFFSAEEGEEEETHDPLQPILDRQSWDDTIRQAGEILTHVGAIRYRLDRMMKMEQERQMPAQKRRFIIEPPVLSEHLRAGAPTAEVNRLVFEVRTLAYALQARLKAWE